MHTRKRLRLRDWLVNMINSGRFSGLKWEGDPKEKIFRVPWKHGSRHGWTVEDAGLFRAWAMYTGKFKEGKDQPDPRKWKTNFRCALNALPDIREIRTRSCPRGKDAFKVYQMRPCLRYRDHSSQSSRHMRETTAKGKPHIQAGTVLTETSLSMNQAVPFTPMDPCYDYWPQETKALNEFDYQIVEIVDKILCDAGSPYGNSPYGSSPSCASFYPGDPGVNPLFPVLHGGDARYIC